MTRLRAALAQKGSYLGNVEKALSNHLEYVERARGLKADVVVFPDISSRRVCKARLFEEGPVVGEIDPEENRRARRFSSFREHRSEFNEVLMEL